uniref:Uncharacterized protein n=1 Tax=Arundo donax TaxID=35708 RepID=A0A0A9C9I9_ARUDO
MGVIARAFDSPSCFTTHAQVVHHQIQMDHLPKK